ncbi:MAG: GxxExxY protein [Ignavibacteriaceae bacterium]
MKENTKCLYTITKLEDLLLEQAINYLEAYELEIGLLINFGAKSLEFKRLINSKFKQKNQGNLKIR